MIIFTVFYCFKTFETIIKIIKAFFHKSNGNRKHFLNFQYISSNFIKFWKQSKLQYEPSTQPKNYHHFVHHTILTICSEIDSKILDKYLNKQYTIDQLPKEITDCYYTYITSSVATEEKYTYSENTGFDFGNDIITKYFLFSIHLENPEMLPNIVITHRLRV